MIKLYVSIPPKYNLADEDVKPLMTRYEDLAHKVEVKLGKYCELNYTLDGLFKVDVEKGKKDFQTDSLIDLMNADYAIFAESWQNAEECLTMHKIAEALNIPIVEL